MKQFFLDYIGLPIFRIHPATKGQEEAIICFNDINYIKRCLHPVSLTYDILNMSFIIIQLFNGSVGNISIYVSWIR
jgi:hypothetical protein